MDNPEDLESKDGDFPNPPKHAPPGYASEHWAAHTRAFAARGLGDAESVPAVTVIHEP